MKLPPPKVGDFALPGASGIPLWRYYAVAMNDHDAFEALHSPDQPWFNDPVEVGFDQLAQFLRTRFEGRSAQVHVRRGDSGARMSAVLAGAVSDVSVTDLGRGERHLTMFIGDPSGDQGQVPWVDVPVKDFEEAVINVQYHDDPWAVIWTTSGLAITFAYEGAAMRRCDRPGGGGLS